MTEMQEEFAGEDVETVEPVEDAEVVEPAEDEKEKKKAKRPELPAGFATPIKFAHALTARLREEGKMAEDEEQKPQVVYSYIRNRAKTDPIPVVFITPEGEEFDEPAEGRRPAFRVNEEGEFEEAMAWWTRKDERKAERAANAKAKAEKKAEKKTKGDDGPIVVDEVDEAEVVEDVE